MWTFETRSISDGSSPFEEGWATRGSQPSHAARLFGQVVTGPPIVGEPGSATGGGVARPPIVK